MPTSVSHNYALLFLRVHEKRLSLSETNPLASFITVPGRGMLPVFDANRNFKKKLR
jgi:hypothetical protein